MSDCFSLPNAAELLREIERLFSLRDENLAAMVLENNDVQNAMIQATDAIEQLLAENAKLNTEIDFWRKREIGCGNCAHVKVSVQEYPCRDCSDYTHDKWEWLGVKEEEK